jgi:hypothetical protein
VILDDDDDDNGNCSPDRETPPNETFNGRTFKSSFSFPFPFPFLKFGVSIPTKMLGTPLHSLPKKHDQTKKNMPKTKQKKPPSVNSKKQAPNKGQQKSTIIIQS